MANHLDLEEQEQLDQLKHFWKSWGSLISILAFIVLGALAGWNMYGYWKNNQAFQASMMLDVVKSSVFSGDASRVDRVFLDIKEKYPKSIQATQAGFLVAKFNYDRGDLQAAKAALQSVIDGGSDINQKFIANLRLASLLLEEKKYDEALEKISISFPADFKGLKSDRRADLLLMQKKIKYAVSDYLIAYQNYSGNLDYRKIIEFKLNSLGVQNNSFVTSSFGVSQ